jgi:hypothetical protein
LERIAIAQGRSTHAARIVHAALASLSVRTTIGQRQASRGFFLLISSHRNSAEL